MRAQSLHLSGPDLGRTVTYDDPVVTIGSAPDCKVLLPVAAVVPQHARIEWVESQCAFHLCLQDGRVFVNGAEVEEVILQDDDQIEFGVDGPLARFHVYVLAGAACKPVRKMLADARAVGGSAVAREPRAASPATCSRTRHCSSRSASRWRCSPARSWPAGSVVGSAANLPKPSAAAPPTW